MKVLGTEENVDQTEIFYLPVIVRFGTSNDKYVARHYRS